MIAWYAGPHSRYIMYSEEGTWPIAVPNVPIEGRCTMYQSSLCCITVTCSMRMLMKTLFVARQLRKESWQRKQGNRRYQTSPALCTPITPFPTDRPHCLRSEFFLFLFVLAWHTEWSLLLHDVIGAWMIHFAAKAAAKIVIAFEWPGQPPKLPLPLGGSAPHLMHGSFGPRQSSSKTVCWSVQPFLYASQILRCTVHCQWGRNPQTAPFP